MLDQWTEQDDLWQNRVVISRQQRQGPHFYCPFPRTAVDTWISDGGGVGYERGTCIGVWGYASSWPQET